MENPAYRLAEAILKAQKIGAFAKSEMPEGWGFVMILASYGKDGAMTYLSSIQREDCIKMIEEFLMKIKNDEPGIGDSN